MSDLFDLPVFPPADVFPMMAEDELAELAEDIKRNGLREPLVVAAVDGEETLIDGRNRREGCKRAGVEPSARRLNGEDPTAFVLSANIHRRHMTKGQQAMAVAMIYPEPAKGGRGRKSSATERFPITPGKLSEARTILEAAPKLAERVLSGATPLGDAYGQVKALEKAADQEDRDKARLRRLAPDLADRVESGDLAVNEANTLYRDRDEEQRQIRSTVFSSLRDANKILKSFAVSKAVSELPEWLAVDDYADEFKQQAEIKPAQLSAAVDEMQLGLDRLREVAAIAQEKQNDA